MKTKLPKGICGFGEIAVLYYSNVSKSYATKKLKRSIAACTPLLRELRQLGYTEKCKEVTPAQKN